MPPLPGATMPWIEQKMGKGQKAYDALVHGQGTPTQNMIESIEASYAAGVTDEFIEPRLALTQQPAFG